MRQIKHALITVTLKPENEAKLTRALHGAEVSRCKPKDTAAIAKALETADVAILQSDLDELILTGPKLKWIHCCHAGLNKSARPEVFERGILLTGSAGRSAQALAEHAMMFMLALTYDVPGLLAMQRQHSWQTPPGYEKRSSLMGKTVGIIGTGNTGVALAERCKAFGMHTLGYRRKAEPIPFIDTMYAQGTPGGLESLLQASDYVVLCINLSDATYHLLGDTQLRLMKPTAYLVNMARGEVVDEDALVALLRSGAIAGAGLDTVTGEPLKADSPLWDLPNVMITPHTTPALPDREERALSYVLENIRAYREGEPMVNQVTQVDIYTK